LRNRRDKPITPAGDRLDISGLSGIVTQSLAKHFDIECKVILIDKPVLPDPLHKLVFFDKMSGTLD
jgi:hypothetical protein